MQGFFSSLLKLPLLWGHINFSHTNYDVKTKGLATPLGIYAQWEVITQHSLLHAKAIGTSQLHRNNRPSTGLCPCMQHQVELDVVMLHLCQPRPTPAVSAQTPCLYHAIALLCIIRNWALLFLPSVLCSPILNRAISTDSFLFLNSFLIFKSLGWKTCF